MCDPITAISLGSLAVGVASSVGGFMQQGQQAKANRKAIQSDYAQQMDTLQQQYKQTNQQATDEMSQRAREAMIERAKLRVAGGESGLFGGSNDRVVNESSFNAGTDIASIESNRQNSLRQIEQEGKGIRAGSISQISRIQRPSLIGTGLQIAGQAVETAKDYQYLSNNVRGPKAKTV
jgi:hypothetical protein